MTGDLRVMRLLLPLVLPVVLACVATVGALGEAPAAPQGPENTEWVLVELGSGSVPALPGGRQPSLRLDAARKQATGYAGCNNYFGSYELAGAALRFGPLAATRRACPDPESAVETRYREALARVRGWKLEAGELLLVDDGGVLARLATRPADAVAPKLETLTLRSRAYTAGQVTLTRGEYRAPAAPGSVSQITVRLTDQRAFATLSGRDTGAVVVVTSLGGSGTFYELALLSRQAESWVNTDTVLLGDRVKVQSIAFERNVVAVALTVHGPKDPMCCPTLATRKRFAVQDSRLVPVEKGAAADPLSLEGTAWQWVQTRFNDGKRVVPATPANYTVRFEEGGKFNARADCNRKGGTYTAKDKRISIQIGNSTMAACEPGSLEEEFVRNLTAGAVYFSKDGDLFIDLKFDSGTMRFAPYRAK